MASEEPIKLKQMKKEIIPETWEVKKLGECCQLIKKQFIPSKDDIRPYIGLEHIEQQTLKLIALGSSEDVNSNKFEFKSGQILFGKLRPYFRKVYLPRFDGVCSTDIWVIDTKNDNDNIFFFYFFTDRRIINEANNSSEGTKMPRAKWDYLEKLEYPIPPLSEQKSIAKILSDLDSKIELNQQMNKTLETTGGTLFKHWFVNFEFLNEDGKPYKSSGGEMVHSEELDKEIPKGWEVGELSKFVTVKGRIGWKGLKKSEYLDEGYAIINGEQFVDDSIEWDNCGRITKERYEESPEIILIEDDILMTKDGTIGKLAYLVHVPEPTTVASGVFVIRNFSENITQRYMYFFFKSKFFERVVESRIEGSVVPHLYQRDIEKIKILIPSKEVLKKFDSVATMTLRTLEKNRKENRILIKIRDSLLPKLMLGKIRVPIEVD